MKRQKVTHLKEVAPPGHHIQRTPEEALQEAVGMLKSKGYDAEQVLVIIFDSKADQSKSAYRWIQGGGCTNADLLWHCCQMKKGIIDGDLTAGMPDDYE